MGLNELLTVKEAAQWLKTSRVQVRRMIRNGELSAVKVGREYRIPLLSIREFVESNVVWGTTPLIAAPLQKYAQQAPPGAVPDTRYTPRHSGSAAPRCRW